MSSGSFLEKTHKCLEDKKIQEVAETSGRRFTCTVFKWSWSKRSETNSFWHPLSTTDFSRFSPCLENSNKNLWANPPLSGKIFSLLLCMKNTSQWDFSRIIWTTAFTYLFSPLSLLLTNFKVFMFELFYVWTCNGDLGIILFIYLQTTGSDNCTFAF